MCLINLHVHYNCIQFQFVFQLARHILIQHTCHALVIIDFSGRKPEQLSLPRLVKGQYEQQEEQTIQP